MIEGIPREESEKVITSLSDVEKMSVREFIDYLKRKNATPSQKGIAKHLDDQYYGKAGIGVGVTAGFIQNGVNVLNLGETITRDDAKILLVKMKNNK